MEEGSVVTSEQASEQASEEISAGSAAVSAANAGRAGGLSPAARAPGSQSSVPSPQSSDDGQLESLRAELTEARALALTSYRRALLAENAGRIVPELVVGSTAEELEGSLEAARRAFEAARAAALVEVASAPIPAGNPIRQGPSVEGMSPFEKIAYGLKRE